MTASSCSAWDQYRTIDVVDGTMAYRQVGSGPLVVLLHGNPTSSFLWRKVAARLASAATVVAPDLLGMGRSSRIPGASGRYSLSRHAAWLERFLDTLLTRLDGETDGRVVVFGHDWGGTLAADWATRKPDRAAGLGWTEATVRPRSWSEEPPEAGDFFRRLRGPEGERLVLEDNVFVEQVLAGAVPALTPDELGTYRQDVGASGEARRAVLDFVRQIPFDGEPVAASAFLDDVARRLELSRIPKLFLQALPGAVLRGDSALWCSSLPRTTTLPIPAGHFVPEDAPALVAEHLTTWITSSLAG